MANNKRIAVIGECMIELRPEISAAGYSDRTIDAQIVYGGDTLNVAVYLARQGVGVEYVTVVGDDSLSDWMVQQWRSNGVGCQLVRREERGLPGMYWIDVDDSGERSFHYWRLESPARRLINDDERRSLVFGQLSQFDSLYFSGITLSLYRETDIALPTANDERLLFGDHTNEEVIERLRSWGIREIVLKRGEKGPIVADGTAIAEVPSVFVEQVVDTTAAGDSFNAGYLSARLRGASPLEAARNGSLLASTVVQHRGAIIPREVMPAVPSC